MGNRVEQVQPSDRPDREWQAPLAEEVDNEPIEFLVEGYVVSQEDIQEKIPEERSAWGLG